MKYKAYTRGSGEEAEPGHGDMGGGSREEAEAKEKVCVRTDLEIL